jgi:hypothetical protein
MVRNRSRFNLEYTDKNSLCNDARCQKESTEISRDKEKHIKAKMVVARSKIGRAVESLFG